MSNKTILALLVSLIALLGVFYFVTTPRDVKPPPPPPPPNSMDVWNGLMKLACQPARGPKTAKWSIIEVGDFQCPICGKSRKYVEELVDKSGGQTKLYFVNYPLDMHMFAIPAATASVAAMKQGKFWAMYDELYSNQDDLNPLKLPGYAKAAGLDVNRFKKDMTSPNVRQIVEEQRRGALSADVTSTPTIFMHEDGSTTVEAYVGLYDQGKVPGLRTFMLKPTPWGTQFAAGDIPPPKGKS